MERDSERTSGGEGSGNGWEGKKGAVRCSAAVFGLLKRIPDGQKPSVRLYGKGRPDKPRFRIPNTLWDHSNTRKIFIFARALKTLQ